MFQRTWLIATIIAACAAAAGRAEPPNTRARLTAVDKGAELRPERASPDPCASNYLPDCVPNRTAACCDPVWIGGGETTLLSLHNGSIALNDGDEEFRVTPEFDLDVGRRYWIGRERPGGFGWRITGWHFDDRAWVALEDVEFFGEPLDMVVANDIDLFTVDFELTRRGRFWGWDLLASGGVRIAGIDRALDLTIEGEDSWLRNDFDGAGLTFAIGARQQLGRSNLHAYGDFRGSIIFGENDFDVRIPALTVGDLAFAGLDGSVSDETVMIWEIQLGLEYEQPTRFGTIIGRAGVEAQTWEVPPVLLGLGDENVGLFGPTFSLGMRR